MGRNFVRIGIAISVVGVAVETARSQQQVWRLESSTSGESLGNTRLGPDLDGDGLPELLISASYGTCTALNDGYVAIVSTTSGELHRWCSGDSSTAFGAGIAWIGDADGGGVDDIAIGEPFYYEPTKSGRDTGRVRVYSTETKLLLHEIVGYQTDGQFGGPITRVGDVDADGVDDLFVGAPNYETNGDGRVWVFSGRSGVQLWTDKGATFSRLGARVIALGDVDGDGITDCAAHATLSGQGEVRVYSSRNGAILRSLMGVAFDELGYSLSNPGDLDGDGASDLLCSGSAPNGEGHVDAYSVTSGALLWRINGPKAPPFGIGEWFGFNICAAGDVNQDGVDDLLVTSAYDDHDARDVGRVDLISGRSQRSLFRFYAGLAGLYRYGTVLTPGTDFDGDGFEDLIIGTYYGGKNKSQGGHVAVYAGNDLWLQADPKKPDSASTVTVDLRGGEPFRLGLVALTAINGVPLFAPLLIAPFDANGELQLLADTDPAISGHDFELLGFAEARTGRGPLMVSSKQLVDVQ